jgi:hypothetical protein
MLTAIKIFFVKCDFSIGHVSSNEDSAVKLSEDEEYDWQSLHHLGMQSEDCPTCENALEVCGVWSVYHMLEQHLSTIDH